MPGLLKNTLLALGLAGVLWLGYVLFLQEDDTALTQENAAQATQASRDAQEFLAVLQDLRGIDFDSSLFDDQKFRQLVDYRVRIQGEPVGRLNPFAPF